jgi:hypothetical protein
MSFWRAIKQAIVDSISINPSQDYADGFASSTGTQVTSSGAWSHRSSDIPAWITVINGSGSTGQYFEFSWTENNSGGTRYASIRIWLTANNAVYQTYEFEQSQV